MLTGIGQSAREECAEAGIPGMVTDCSRLLPVAFSPRLSPVHAFLFFRLIGGYCVSTPSSGTMSWQ
ncbi:MAG: hypothetical protein HGA97_01830 [Chlorobiaceae bacterium]|nr:hypothetical protein [Chlorobiaceae bacterium]